jgi:hypothetical protein
LSAIRLGDMLKLLLGELEMNTSDKVFEVLEARWSNNGSGNVRVGERPGEGNRGHRGVSLFGNWFDAATDLLGMLVRLVKASTFVVTTGKENAVRWSMKGRQKLGEKGRGLTGRSRIGWSSHQHQRIE